MNMSRLICGKYQEGDAGFQPAASHVRQYRHNEITHRKLMSYFFSRESLCLI